jgi:hypothetical protein
MNPVSFKIDTPEPTEALKQVDAYWSMMAPSFEYGGMEYSAGQLAQDLMTGDVVLIRVWVDDEVVSVSAVTRREFFGTKDLHLMATGSTHDINEWIDDLDKVLVQLAQETGCDTITVQTREGMGRISKRAGYKVHQVIIRKRVGVLQ